MVLIQCVLEYHLALLSVLAPLYISQEEHYAVPLHIKALISLDLCVALSEYKERKKVERGEKINLLTVSFFSALYFSASSASHHLARCFVNVNVCFIFKGNLIIINSCAMFFFSFLQTEKKLYFFLLSLCLMRILFNFNDLCGRRLLLRTNERKTFDKW